MYQRHYNRHAAELWWKHREVLRAVSRRFNFTLARRAAIIREHRELIALVKAGEADKAAELVARHVEGSGRHILEQMRALQRRPGRIERSSAGHRCPDHFRQRQSRMKITGVRPWLIKSDASYWGEFLFVEVTTDEGVSGWGEITTTTKLANRALCAILRQIGIAVAGEDPAHIEHLWHKIFRSFTYMGSRGAAVECVSAIDIALWDIRGKVARQADLRAAGRAGARRDRALHPSRPAQVHQQGRRGQRDPGHRRSPAIPRSSSTLSRIRAAASTAWPANSATAISMAA